MVENPHVEFCLKRWITTSAASKLLTSLRHSRRHPLRTFLKSRSPFRMRLPPISATRLAALKSSTFTTYPFSSSHSVGKIVIPTPSSYRRKRPRRVDRPWRSLVHQYRRRKSAMLPSSTFLVPHGVIDHFCEWLGAALIAALLEDQVEIAAGLLNEIAVSRYDCICIGAPAPVLQTAYDAAQQLLAAIIWGGAGKSL